MSPLDAFLTALDLDELLYARLRITALEPHEESRIEEVIREWSDRQAIANLLFYPDLIPERIRFEALDRGLHSPDESYLPLVTTVGLQGTDPGTVSENYRKQWTGTLLEKIRSHSSALASRASVTIRTWLNKPEAARLLSLYPVRDDAASKNILAFALLHFGDLPPAEFLQAMRECGVSDEAMPSFEEFRAEYGLAKTLKEPRALWMPLPLYSYIPNLSEHVA